MLRRLFGWKPKEAVARTDASPDKQTASTLSIVVEDVTDATFDKAVLRSEQLVVVDVWAEWCQPCETMSAYVTWLAQEFAGRVAVFALDADENPAVAERYTIMGLPTLLFFRAGVEVDRQVGLLSYEEFVAKVEALVAADEPS